MAMEPRNHELVVDITIDLNSYPPIPIACPAGLVSGHVAIEAGYLGGRGWWRVVGDDDAVLAETTFSAEGTQPWERLLAFLGLEQPAS